MRYAQLTRTLIALALLLPLPAAAQGWVGAYAWGGVLTRTQGVARLYDTVHLALANGFDTIRINPDPSGIQGVDLAAMCASDDNLACYARIMLASSVWDDPFLKRLMLTTLDRTCQQVAPIGRACMTTSALAPFKTQIKAEYAALFSVLKERFGNRRIQFILSNWEGDNAVFCGSAYEYSLNRNNFPANCRAIWEPGQTNAQRIQAHLLWHSYRDEAVAEFNAANPGFDMIHAPEILSYNLFDGGCGGYCNPTTDTILKQMALSGGRKYCSYSSYNTQGPPGGAYLASIIEILKTCQNLIIGEATFDVSTPNSLALNIAVFKALDEIRRVPGVLGVIPWNAVNSVDGKQKSGFWEVDGTPYLYQHLGPLRPMPPASTFRE